MNICVCVKQVPDTNEIRIDKEKHTLIRAGVPGILNPFDAYALEAAVRIKEEAEAENEECRITVISMGPEQVSKMLKSCIASGADEAYLISGRSFGGSDTYATSYVLSEAIRALEEKNGISFDLILCGKQAIDGDTAQVGPEMAEHLSLPQVTNALDIIRKNECLHVKRESNDGYDVISVSLPALVTVSKIPGEVRCPTLRATLAARKREINVLSEKELPMIKKEKCGLAGSPTKVKSTYVPVRDKECVIFRDIPAEEAAVRLAEMLSDTVSGILSKGEA